MRKPLALALLLAILFAPAAARAVDDPAAEIDVAWGVRIPMADGTRLSATVYRPHAMPAPLPALVALTPYIADGLNRPGAYFAKHGYAYVSVDTRGRGNSEGTFAPLDEGRDGRDIVEWAAKQPWCNGKVATWGGSYVGMFQWQTAALAPPHLVTMVPTAPVRPGLDFPMFNNIASTYNIQWLTYVSGTASQQNLFGADEVWRAYARRIYVEGRAFADLDTVASNTTTAFATWLQHPTRDAYWASKAPTPAQYANMTWPVLTITGMYDGDQPGALAYYADFMRYALPEARAKHYLVIGPWDHAGTRRPAETVGGLKFGSASIIDIDGLHKAWYDWTLKGGSRPAFLKQRVAYYVTGAEEWRYADSLEGITNTKETLYLASSDGAPNDPFHSGTLAPTVGASTPSDRYTYDPRDVRAAELDNENVENSITDERYAINLYGNGLVYHTAPFDRDTIVTGVVRLHAYIAMDVPDTDFQVSLYEIRRDGQSVSLTADWKRARYRESLERERLVTPGKVERYDFTSFTWMSRRIAKGSRLRLVIGSPNTIGIEKNYNGGGIVARETMKDARTAHVVLYHDAAHPSALELPIER